MIDGIIKADGTSRLMRATLPATYEEFRAQCRAGAQPLDILFDALGWSQLPTFLNKANLLRDPTAALFGFGNGVVPDTIFDWLGQHNTHWWSREGAVPATYILGDENTQQRIAGKGYTRHVYYSDSVSVDSGGNVSLVEPVSGFVVYGVYNSDDPDANELGNLNAIIGKYFYVNNAPDDIYFRTSTENAYFDSGSYVSAQPVYGIPATVDGEVVYIHSTDRNAYPDSGTVDGLTYQYLGIPFQNAVTAPKIASLSYVGTGAKGDKEIIFPVVPKIVFVSRNDGSYVYTPYVWGASVLFGINSSIASFSKVNLDVTVSGATLTVDGGTASINHLDVAGVTYTLLYIV